MASYRYASLTLRRVEMQWYYTENSGIAEIVDEIRWQGPDGDVATLKAYVVEPSSALDVLGRHGWEPFAVTHDPEADVYEYHLRQSS